MPWTLLTLLLPLPVIDRLSPADEDEIRIVTPSRSVTVPHGMQDLTRPTSATGPRQSQYASTVRDLIREEIAQIPSASGAMAPVSVIHPFVRPEAGVTADESVELHDEQIIAIELLRWVEDSAMPGVTPIHLFIDVPINAIEEAQKYFAERDKDALGDPTPPEVFAICHPATNQLHWFV